MARLTEANAEHILQAGLRITSPISWNTKSVTWRWFEVGVHNDLGVALVLHMQVNQRTPERYSIHLRSGPDHLRRLDIRGSHANKDSERRIWNWETHKHRWTDEFGDGWAYTPDGIPADGDAVAPQEYRAVFEAFCDECAIMIETQWIEPVVAAPSRQLEMPLEVEQ